MVKGSNRASFVAGVAVTLGVVFGPGSPLRGQAWTLIDSYLPPPQWWPWPSWLPAQAHWGTFADPAGTVRLWSYDRDGPTGPSEWGHIHNGSGVPLFPACAPAEGARQSPINILTPAGPDAGSVGDGEEWEEQDGVPLYRSFRVTSYTLMKWPAPGNNIPSPGFQVRPAVGNATWVIDGVEHSLLQWHYHSPSEHTLNGQRFPLEGHYVWENTATGALAVWGILYPLDTFDRDNPYLAPWWGSIHYEHNISLAEGDAIDLAGMVNDVVSGQGGHPLHYRYEGSLTTPPCLEGVKWHVATSRTGISSGQKVAYKYSLRKVDNARELQPLNGRSIARVN